MLKIPKIIVTNVDEDPATKRERKRKKIMEICGKFAARKRVADDISMIFKPFAFSPEQHCGDKLDYGNQQIVFRVRHTVRPNHNPNYDNAVLSVCEDALRQSLWCQKTLCPLPGAYHADTLSQVDARQDLSLCHHSESAEKKYHHRFSTGRRLPIEVTRPHQFTSYI